MCISIRVSDTYVYIYEYINNIRYIHVCVCICRSTCISMYLLSMYIYMYMYVSWSSMYWYCSWSNSHTNSDPTHIPTVPYCTSSTHRYRYDKSFEQDKMVFSTRIPMCTHFFVCSDKWLSRQFSGHFSWILYHSVEGTLFYIIAYGTFSWNLLYLAG